MARYGIGSPSGRKGGAVNAAPTAPGNGSGGAGALFQAPAAAASWVRSDLSDLRTGQITLGLVELSVLVLIGFYLWTRSNQGG